MVRILVDYGTNVDTQNGEGQTPLHIAAAEGDEALLKYFYGVRASASIADNQGESAAGKTRFVSYFFFNFSPLPAARRPHTHASGGREWTRTRHRDPGGQIQGEHLRAHQGWQHTDAYRITQWPC